MLTTPWSIILAAGHGRRLSSLTGGVPKQFWSPRGGTTLLEDTARRMAKISPASRTVTVIDRSQQHYLEGPRAIPATGRVVSQPLDRGTAAGVLFGLSQIDAPDALVVLTPSDHGVANIAEFHRGIALGAAEIRRGQADVILFAVKPTSAAADFGWIVPSAGATGSLTPFHRVGSFAEKPDPALAHALFVAGAAWNTMVMVARLSTLLDLYRLHLPEIATAFDEARQLPATRREAFLARHYPRLAPADFSRDLLAQARRLHVHVWPSSMGWTDLGTPERLLRWLSTETTGNSAPGDHTYDHVTSVFAVA
jgi:mannose-1-phosphate guanylyltransferase